MFGSSRTSGLQVLSHAASRLLSRPVSLSAGPAFLPSLPSAKRLSELVLFMRSAHDGLVADPYYGGRFLRPSASRCAAGTIEPGSLVKVRCMEICAMCETYLGLLDARSGEARALLERTHASAHQLGQTQGGNISELDIAWLEDRIADALPPGPVYDLFEKCGFGDGEATVDRADIDTPKLHALLYEVMDAAPLRGVAFIVIANCTSPQDAGLLRDALDARGLHDVKVVPRLETRKDMKKLFAGDYQGAHSGRVMMDCGNYGKREGGVQRDIDVVRFELACREQGFEARLVTGDVTVPAGAPPVPLTHNEIANVQLALQPLISAQRADRRMYSDFALGFQNAAMGDEEMPFPGSDPTVQFGQAFGCLSPQDIAAMASAIQAIRQGGSDGEKHLMDTLLQNQASQLARLPGRDELVEVWRARGLAPGDTEAMWRSVANVQDLLAQTGHGGAA